MFYAVHKREKYHLPNRYYNSLQRNPVSNCVLYSCLWLLYQRIVSSI